MAERDETVGRLTEVVNQLRRALRASVRRGFPWEALPLPQPVHSGRQG